MSNIVTIPVNRKMTADSPHAVHYGDPCELSGRNITTASATTP